MQDDRPDVENCEKIYKCVFFFFVLFFIWLHPFILSGVISSLISSSILGTYQPGEFLFQCPIFLPFHIIHGVLKARTLKWFATPFSSGPHSVRPLHDDRSVFGGPIRHALEVSKKRKEKGADNLLEDIMVENFHNEGKETDTQIEEAQRVSNKIDTKTDYN